VNAAPLNLHRGVIAVNEMSIVVDPPTPSEIRKIRKEVGTQEYCARKVGINLSNWQRWERGETKPHVSTWALFLLSTDRHPHYNLKALKKQDSVA